MFLDKLLPATGLYCVAMALPKGGFRHFFYDSLDQAKNQIQVLDSNQKTVYIAQATFDPDKIRNAQQHNAALPPGHKRSDRAKERGQVNALQLKNFFLDVDCGEKWPLKDQREGVREISKFIQATGLPTPFVVNSGNGLYVHWILEESIPAEKWRTVAFILKNVVAAYSPKIGGDASRTSDSASVLRPPGVHNRKPGREIKPVTLIKGDAPLVSFAEFVDKLKKAAAKKKINRDAVLAPKPVDDVNAEFFINQDIVNDAEQIADKCAQLDLMRSSGGNISEPVWYACMGLLAFCFNGIEKAHEWSREHPDYNYTETEEKLNQWNDSGVGPTTCAKFGYDNPQVCIGCPHNGKIKSPVILGRPAPVEKPVNGTSCPVPEGFRRADDGLYKEVDGVWHKFYDQDLYVDYLAYDDSLGYEVTVIKHKLPHEGSLECTIRSSAVHDPKTLLISLADNHIKVLGQKEKKIMVGYLESYQARLQRHRTMTLLLNQMGWRKRNKQTMFVHGKKVYYPDGRVDDASFAKNIPSVAKGFRTSGSLDKWVEATRIFNAPGMEPFAFAFLAGGFGAPLMRFTGLDGALISMVGSSGIGKTLMLRFLLSVWGYHNDLMMLRDDTTNSRYARLAVYGNLPAALDEVTNIDGMGASDFAYGVTNGCEKNRLDRNAVERERRRWNTIAVCSSNSSFIEKLALAKRDPGAEMYRVFEYDIQPCDAINGQSGADLFWTVDKNYGHAGEKYAQWLVANEESVEKQFNFISDAVKKKLGFRTEERFWGALISAGLCGGAIAQRLGLIDFPLAPLHSWLEKTLSSMRSNHVDLSTDSVTILGQMLDHFAANRLIVKGNPLAPEGCVVLENPRGELLVRYEVDNCRVYVPGKVARAFISTGFGNPKVVRQELLDKRVLLNTNKKKVLGAGTMYKSAQQPCWELDMNNQYLDDDTKKQIRTARDLSKDTPPVLEQHYLT